MKDVRKTNIFYIEHLARKFKNYNIVLKPHPNENVKFWKDFIKNYPNIKLLLGKILVTYYAYLTFILE